MANNLYELAEQLGEALVKRKWKLVTAESCTGGWVGQAVTSVPGSSKWFDRGFITYCNVSKQELLDVKPETLEKYGAVSEETVKEMTEGALKNSHADLSLAITGIAGPGGGTPEKPMGTVCFGWAFSNQKTQTCCEHFSGDRNSVREQSVRFVLERLLSILCQPPRDD